MRSSFIAMTLTLVLIHAGCGGNEDHPLEIEVWVFADSVYVDVFSSDIACPCNYRTVVGECNSFNGSETCACQGATRSCIDSITVTCGGATQTNELSDKGDASFQIETGDTCQIEVLSCEGPASISFQTGPRPSPVDFESQIDFVLGTVDLSWSNGVATDFSRAFAFGGLDGAGYECSTRGTSAFFENVETEFNFFYGVYNVAKPVTRTSGPVSFTIFSSGETRGGS